MVEWSEISTEFNDNKKEFDRVYKCLNKNKRPSKEIFDNHVTNLIGQYNILIQLYLHHSKVLTLDHKNLLENDLFLLRDRLLNLFTRLKLNILVPISIKKFIDLNKHCPNFNESIAFDELSEEEIIEIDDRQNLNMATKAEFLRNNSKIIPDFDGSIGDLQKFLDALSLLKEDVGAHEATAVSLIKTKLSSNARSCILDTDNTIDLISARLRSTIKGETSEVLKGKIMNLKQNHKSATVFVEELTKITDSLRNAFISEGLSYDMANKFSTNVALDAMRTNSSNEEVKFIMKAGNFTDINDAVSKFVTSSNGQTSKQVLFARNNSFRGNQRFNSQYKQKPFQMRPNFSHNNSYSNQSFSNNRSFNNSNNRGRNNFVNRGRNFNGNSNRANVRVVEAGNSVPPQTRSLGEAN